jgi:hypothetical protein
VRFLPAKPGGRIIIGRLPFLLTYCFVSLAATLPETVPVPEPRPDIAESSEEKPVEKAKPGDVQPENKSQPADTKPSKDDKADVEEAYVPPPIETEDPKLYARCTAELKAIGAQFNETERINDGNGCGIDRPIELKSLGNGVTVAPPSTLRCRTAVNLARWTRDIVIPMLRKSQPKEALAVVNQASAYICRKRNGADTGKISEHAHGNAVDIAGFTFKSGKTFTIAPREEDSTLNGAFQRAIASAACLYFSTVLDPGSDKAHETHLHLDTLGRKGGYRYCW